MTQTQIAFAADKNGTRIAHRWSTGARRWIRVSTENARVMIAMGEAREVVRLSPNGSAR